MNLQQELDRYFSDLEHQDEFSGVVRITQAIENSMPLPSATPVDRGGSPTR